MIINPLIHGLSIAARLFMVLVLAAKIPEHDVAQVGLIITTVIWIVMLFDYESGTDLGRQIAKVGSHSEQEAIFRVYCSYTSTRLVIAFILFAVFILINNFTLALICILSLMETIIFSSRKVFLGLGLIRASIFVEFARSAPWAVMFSLFIFFEVFEYNNYVFLVMWLVSSVIVCIGIFIYFNYLFRGSVFQVPHFVSISSLFRNNSALFISSFFLVFVETVPRYVLGMNGLHEQLAAYIFFSGFVFSIPVFMWIVTIGKDYRSLAAFHTCEEHFSVIIALKFYKKFIINGILIYFLLSLVSYATVTFLVGYFIQGAYEDYLTVLPLLFVLPVLIFLDTIGTNALALKGRDRQNLTCAIISILTMILLLGLRGHKFDIWEVPWILGATYSLSAILRFIYLWRFSRAANYLL